MVKRRRGLFWTYVGSDQNVGMAHHRDDAHQTNVDRLRANGAVGPSHLRTNRERAKNRLSDFHLNTAFAASNISSRVWRSP
jgi:hypothetical protein